MIYPRENPTHYGVGKWQRHLYFDTMADYGGLPMLDEAAPGSDAACLETGDVYILGGDGEWRLF